MYLSRRGLVLIIAAEIEVVSAFVPAFVPTEVLTAEVITAEVNQRLGLRLSDAFCGFKAYRVAALREIRSAAHCV